jgi:hypothetical protein
MKTAQELADLIMQRANDGYHRRDDYPAFAMAPWDDRLRWSDYIKKVTAEVLAEELQGESA